MDKIIGFHLGIGTVYPPKWVETPTKYLLDWGLYWRRERLFLLNNQRCS